MQSMRRLFRDRPALAALVIALALCLRIALPAGMMLAPQAMVLKVTICADATHGLESRDVVIPLADPVSQSGKTHAKDSAPCPYGALSLALVGVDAVLLAIALAFILAAGIACVRSLRLAAGQRLRPPLRGPPALV